MRTFLLIGTLLLLMDVTAGNKSAPPKLTDGVYFPGYVLYPAPLSEFVPPYLHQACERLMSGDLPLAEKAFAQEIRHHPNDLGAILGFLQAAHGHRDGLLPQYQQDVIKNPTPANHFKLGVLAWYMFGDLGQHSDNSAAAQLKWKMLQRLAWDNLEIAYKRTGDTVAGLTISFASIYLGHGLRVDFYEDMIRRLGGESVYRAYLTAKQDHWIASQPPIPHLPYSSLKTFAFLVSEIRACDAARSSPTLRRIVNGVVYSYAAPLPPFTPEQKRAMAFLGEWDRRIFYVVHKKKAAR